MLAIISFVLLTTSNATPPPLHPQARELANSCIAEGQAAQLCTCYAGFIADNTSTRELTALSVLSDPKHRGSLQSALKALKAEGLTTSEIFEIAMRADALKDDATAQCEPEDKDRAP